VGDRIDVDDIGALGIELLAVASDEGAHPLAHRLLGSRQDHPEVEVRGRLLLQLLGG
jgi:hypothetical protein